MSEYPIEGLMNTAMNSIKEMIDVNTIIGEPIETSNNVVVIPVSKVNVGFAAGGSEFNGAPKKNKEQKDGSTESRMPFGGGSGAGIGICPIAFIVIQQSGVKLLPVEHSSSLDKLLDLMPDFADKINNIIDSHLPKNKNKEEVKMKVDIPEQEVEYEYDETTDNSDM